jgi:DNA-binding NarL/FixJ family response regulator
LCGFASFRIDWAIIERNTNKRRLKAKSRARRLVDIRRALSAILTEQGWSVREIASELCRSHSTVVHFVQTHQSLLSTDTAYQHLFHQLKDATRWQA